MAQILNSKSQTSGNLAIEKLKAEAKDLKGKNQTVISCVLDTLISFCNQSEEFAKAVYESEKTFVGCIVAVLKDHGNCLSDIEAYCRAVAYYFETADISFEMTLHLNSEDKAQKSAVVLNLFDML